MSYTIEKYEGKKGTTYRYKVPYYVNGQRKFRTKGGFKTKRQATQAAKELEVQLATGYNLEFENLTVADLWKEYQEIAFPKLTLTSRNFYIQIYNNHISPELESIRLTDLNYSLIQRFILSKSEYSRPFISSIKSLLHHMIGIAIRSGYIKNDPLQFVEIYSQKNQPKKDQYIDQDSFCKIAEAVSAGRSKRALSYSMALYLGYYLGLRIAEALALQWEDIDFEAHEVHVRHQLRYRSGTRAKKDAYLSDQLKTEASKATLPLPAPLEKILLEWRTVNPYALICADRDGSFLTVDSIEKICKKYNFHFHMLRHTYATNVVMHCDPKTAASLVRHANVSMTLNVYTEIRKDYQQQVIKEVFGSDVPKLIQNPALMS